MGGDEARDYWEDAGLVRLVAGVLLPVAAWALDVQTSYALVKWSCATGVRGPLLMVPAFSLGLVAWAAVLSWGCWRRLREERPEDDGSRLVDRSYFLAVAGLSLSAITTLFVLTTFMPRLWLSPCE